MVTKDKIQEILRNKGIVLEKIVSDPRVYEKACNIAYISIPIPLRWFIGKKRVRRIIDATKEHFIGRGRKDDCKT